MYFYILVGVLKGKMVDWKMDLIKEKIFRLELLVKLG